MRRTFEGAINGGVGYQEADPPLVEPDPEPPIVVGYGYVYFARRGDEVKIGFSQNPDQRINALQNMGGFVFDETVVIEADRRLETHLHRQFQEFRTIGEWFTMTPEIRSAIASIQQ